jgi:putative transcriptional regulator
MSTSRYGLNEIYSQTVMDERVQSHYGVSGFWAFMFMYDLTQAELAKKLDVTRATINAIENQRYDPSLKLAFQIARFFNVPIEEIFIYEGEKVAKQAPVLQDLMDSLGQDVSLEDFRDYLLRKNPGGDQA